MRVVTMDELQAAIRKRKKWAHLAEILAQHDHDRPTFGVTYSGCVHVNPAFATKLGVTKMLKLIRAELAVASELRSRVNFME